jgi:uncharacterized small protein (DUF1192 family)
MKRLLILAPLLLFACDRRSTDVAPDRDAEAARAALSNESDAIATVMADARVVALQKQVDRLDAEIAELKGGRQALDTQLLAQRLDAVEQRVYARLPDASTPTPESAPLPTDSATPQVRPPPVRRQPRPTPTPTPRRSGLDLDLPKADR